MGGGLVLVAFFHCLAGEEKEIARYESEFSNDSMAARVLPGLSLHNLGSSDKQREVPLAAKPQHTRSPHLLDACHSFPSVLHWTLQACTPEPLLSNPPS